VRFRRLDPNNPRDVRLDVMGTTAVSVLMLIGGLVNLSEREFFDAGSFLFGGVVGLGLAYRNYRIARKLGWLPARGPRNQ
jgi:hypothetical protein